MTSGSSSWSHPGPSDELFVARARLVADLHTTGAASPATVSLLDEAVTGRRWWVEQWPQGATYAIGLVAQDLQDALLDRYGRWPLCTHCPGDDPFSAHALHVHPEIGGPDPHWVCETTGTVIAPVGGLPG